MGRNTCWYCGEDTLIWGGDNDLNDVYGEGEGIITNLTCSNCGAEVTYELRDDSEDDD